MPLPWLRPRPGRKRAPCWQVSGKGGRAPPASQLQSPSRRSPTRCSRITGGAGNRTHAVNLNYYENHILPWFKGRPVADITRREVLEWFESLHARPASANRSLPVLSVILRQAEVYGYRPEDSNPCKDIKRYRRRARERFLSPDEIRRVDEVLNRYDETRPAQAAVIRLLLLTGCRKDKLLTLKWRDYREGKK